jgi:hypothetical protein
VGTQARATGQEGEGTDSGWKREEGQEEGVVLPLLSHGYVLFVHCFSLFLFITMFYYYTSKKTRKINKQALNLRAGKW